MKNRSVSICTGGGGRALPAKLGVEDVSSLCHAELVSASIQRCVLPVLLVRFRNKFGMTVKSIVCMSAFTMAEILLSLTIIGVVAAITLPSLTGNINERTWNTQRKALYARFSQAIALMPALNGYGTLRETTDSAGSTSIEDTAAETFVTAGLSKVLKINNICDNEHLQDCGIPEKLTALNGSNKDFPLTIADLNPANISVSADADIEYSYSALNTKAAAFETANGESIAVYYNPNCTSLLSEPNNINMQKKVCANFVYDLNGSKGPNTIGKDMGVMSAFYPTDSVLVAPIPHIRDAVSSTIGTSSAVSGVCVKQDPEYRLSSLEELSSVSINRNIMDNLTVYYWTSTFNDDGRRYVLNSNVIVAFPIRTSYPAYVRCVKR